MDPLPKECDMRKKTLIIVAALGILVVAATVRIAQVSATCEEQYAPTGVPFVWQLNTVEVFDDPWVLPSTAFIEPEASEVSVSFGEIEFKTFEEVQAEIEYPDAYTELFDENEIVKLLFLPMTFYNGGQEAAVPEFYDLEIYHGLIPQSFSSWITPLYNEEEESYDIEPGESRTIMVVHRMLKSGYTDEQWERIEEGPFEMVLTDYSSKTKYIHPLTIKE